jgi:hypothetical protein
MRANGSRTVCYHFATQLPKMERDRLARLGSGSAKSPMKGDFSARYVTRTDGLKRISRPVPSCSLATARPRSRLARSTRYTGKKAALNGISTLEAPQSAIAKSVQRLNVKVISSQGEIAMPMISADTYRLSIQVPESWLIPSAPRISVSAMDVTWSLNSDVIAAMRTPPRPNKGLISTG